MFAFALFGCVIVKDTPAEMEETYTPDATSAAAVDDVGVKNTVEFELMKGRLDIVVVAAFAVNVNVPTGRVLAEVLPIAVNELY